MAKLKAKKADEPADNEGADISGDASARNGFGDNSDALKREHQDNDTKDAGGVLYLQVPFSGERLSVRVEVSGGILQRKHIEKVRKYLELAEDDLVISIAEDIKQQT